MQAGINWSFAEFCDKAQTVKEISARFMREVRALGFSYAACASHVDPLKPPPGAVMMVNYPQVWLERFSAKGYATRDPVFLAARRQALPFQWSDWRFRSSLEDDQIEILNEAADAGLIDGFTVPIFAPLSLASKDRIAATLATMDVPAGSVVFREGDPGDRFYVVGAGDLAIRVGEREIAAAPGDFFGEIALLHDMPRTGTVTAVSDATLHALEREDFLAIMAGHPLAATEARAVAGDRLARD